MVVVVHFVAVIIGPGASLMVARAMYRTGQVVQAAMEAPRHSLLLAVSMAICGAFLGLVVLVVGSALVTFVTGIFFAVPPAVFILIFSVWVCVLTQRWVHRYRYRWVRYGVDVLVAAMSALERRRHRAITIARRGPPC